MRVRVCVCARARVCVGARAWPPCRTPLPSDLSHLPPADAPPIVLVHRSAPVASFPPSSIAAWVPKDLFWDDRTPAGALDVVIDSIELDGAHVPTLTGQRGFLGTREGAARIEGTAEVVGNQVVIINVTATDEAGQSVMSDFTIMIIGVAALSRVVVAQHAHHPPPPCPDPPPQLGMPFAIPAMFAGVAFNFTIPASAFTDNSPTSMLAVTGEVRDGDGHVVDTLAVHAGTPGVATISGTWLVPGAANAFVHLVCTDPAGQTRQLVVPVGVKGARGAAARCRNSPHLPTLPQMRRHSSRNRRATRTPRRGKRCTSRSTACLVMTWTRTSSCCSPCPWRWKRAARLGVWWA